MMLKSSVSLAKVVKWCLQQNVSRVRAPVVTTVYKQRSGDLLSGRKPFPSKLPETPKVSKLNTYVNGLLQFTRLLSILTKCSSDNFKAIYFTSLAKAQQNTRTKIAI